MTAALTLRFEEHPLTAIEYRGRPVVIARELGAALGYADPGRLAENVAEKWSDEFEAGRDFVKLDGSELTAFKAMLRDIPLNRGDVDRPDRTARLLLLTESGAQLAAILSRTPAGARFRRWLVDVLLPAWREAQGSKPSPAALAEARVGVDARRRLHRLGLLSRNELAEAEVAWAEAQLGRELPELRRVAARVEVAQVSMAEKRERVLRLLADPETASLSSRALAGVAGVSHTFVDELRGPRALPAPARVVEAAPPPMPPPPPPSPAADDPRVSWVMELTTRSTVEKTVLLALVSLGPPGAWVQPRTIDIATRASCSDRAVQTALKHLARDGLLEVNPVSGERTRYRVVLRQPTTDPRLLRFLDRWTRELGSAPRTPTSLLELAREVGLASDVNSLGRALGAAGTFPAPGYRLWRGKVGEERGYTLTRA